MVVFNRYFFDLLNHAVEVGVARGNAGLRKSSVCSAKWLVDGG
ncbi:hypothetical protein ACLB1T_09325 [Escherichia coli]